MGLFSKKKKRGTTLTDEDRENAIERRRQNKQLRDLQHQQDILIQTAEVLKAKADIQQLKEELTPDEDNMFGLGSQEMQLLNILSKGKLDLTSITNPLNSNLTTPLGNAPEQTTVNPQLEQQSNQILGALPLALKEQIKGLPPDAMKLAIDKIHMS